MAEKSSFFNSVAGDRQYTAEDFATYFAGLLTTGVLSFPSTNLQVLSNETYVVSVQTGRAFINGYNYENDGTKNFVVDAADGVLDRKDLIVVRLDLGSRSITSELKKGTPSASPVAPTVQRDDLIYELAIAEITVPKAATKITQANILDTRIDSSRCGYVNSLITADTTTIFNDYESWYNQKTAEFEESWNTWFSNAQASDNPNKQNTITFGMNAVFPSAPVVGDVHIDQNGDTGEKNMYRYMEGSTWEKLTRFVIDPNYFYPQLKVSSDVGKQIKIMEGSSDKWFIESNGGTLGIIRPGQSVADIGITSAGVLKSGGNDVLTTGNYTFALLDKKDLSLNNHVNVPINSDWLITDGTNPWTFTTTKSGLYSIEASVILMTTAGQWVAASQVDVSIWLGTIGSSTREYAALELANLVAGIQTFRSKTMQVFLSAGQVVNVTCRHNSAGTNPLQLRGFSVASKFRVQQITKA